MGWRQFCFLVAGKWQGQRAKAVEKALLGKALDVDTLIRALQALPQDLHPSPTPGVLPSAPVIQSNSHKCALNCVMCLT